MAEPRKLSAAEQRLFLRMQSEKLRAEAIEATGDPQARASQAPSMKGVMEDLLPGGEQEALGKATLDLAIGKHVNKAAQDPQKPASQTDRLANEKEDETNNVNLQEKVLGDETEAQEVQVPKVAAPAPKAEAPAPAPAPVKAEAPKAVPVKGASEEPKQ